MSAGPPVTPTAAYQIDLFCIRQQMDTECPNISHIGGYLRVRSGRPDSGLLSGSGKRPRRVWSPSGRCAAMVSGSAGHPRLQPMALRAYQV